MPPTVSLVKTYDVANVTRVSMRQLCKEIFDSVVFRFADIKDGSVDRNGYTETEDSGTPGNLVIRIYEYDSSEAPNSSHITNLIATVMTGGEITSMDTVVTNHVAIPVLSACYCRATRTTNLSIPNGTNTDVTFPTEDYDVGDMHDEVTDTDRITIPSGGDGIYLSATGCGFAANSTGQRSLSLTVNGALLNNADKMFVDASNNKTKLQVSSCLQLVAGDIVRAMVKQTSGDSLNLEAAHLDLVKVS